MELSWFDGGSRRVVTRKRTLARHSTVRAGLLAPRRSRITTVVANLADGLVAMRGVDVVPTAEWNRPDLGDRVLGRFAGLTRLVRGPSPIELGLPQGLRRVAACQSQSRGIVN
jgi:hypothetical protein